MPSEFLYSQDLASHLSAQRPPDLGVLLAVSGSHSPHPPGGTARPLGPWHVPHVGRLVPLPGPTPRSQPPPRLTSAETSTPTSRLCPRFRRAPPNAAATDSGRGCHLFTDVALAVSQIDSKPTSAPPARPPAVRGAPRHLPGRRCRALLPHTRVRAPRTLS